MADAQREMITLDNGKTLTVRAVSQVALDEIISDLGGFDLQRRLSSMSDSDRVKFFATYSPTEIDAYLKAQRSQMLYCLGWGVVDTPTADDITVLDLLGHNHPLEPVRRVNWLLYVAELTRADKARIIGNVMALTYFGGFNG